MNDDKPQNLENKQFSGSDASVFPTEPPNEVNQTPQELAPKEIGPYQIIRELGHGGMGAVYLAKRADEQYQKNVAIKVIKRGMDTQEIIQRFRRERQILASLDHPNIAKLLDGGTTADGLPFFIMEYVQGRTFLEYCDTHKLNTKERLKLFRTICSAVHYAHQNLVVHRDLKPGNILITAAGVPKLLDFGLAKLLNPDFFSELAPPTATEIRLMTPEYASPEQARGEPITISTDIYSLGVILYELLSGHRPYRFPSRNPIDILHAIDKVEPERPSTAVSKVEVVGGIDLKPELVSSTREASTEKLRRQLQGDLDNIVLMALRKEPQRRYSSVDAFSEDIRRHLEGLPVTARKPTASYRASKFIRRNKAAMAASAALILLLIGFAATMAVQSQRVARERDAATRERDRAEQITSFLMDLFNISDVTQSRGNTVTAREILDRGTEKISTTLTKQPDVRANLLNTMGEVYVTLGLYDKAQPLFAEALKVRKQLYANENLDVAQSLTNLGKVLWRKGDYKASEPLLREALNIRQKILGKDNLQVVDAQRDLANLLGSSGDYAQAEPLFREALAMQRHLIGNDRPETAQSLNDLANMLWEKGAYNEAEPLCREALDIRRKVLGSEDWAVSQSMINLANLLYIKGDYDETEKLYRDALAIQRKTLGKEHPLIALSLNNLGYISLVRGRYSQSESMFRESLAMRRKLLGEEHPDIVQSLVNLGELSYRKGDYKEAEPLYREALAIGQKLGISVNNTLMHLGELLVDVGRQKEAQLLIEEGLTSRRKLLPEKHPDVSTAESIMGKYLASLGRYEEAEPLLLESYNNLRSKLSVRDMEVRDALDRIIFCYHRWGEKEKEAEYRNHLKTDS